MRTTVVVCLLGALGLSGCVKKAEYDALSAKLNGINDSLADSQANAKSIQEALVAAEAEVDELRNRIEDLEQQLAAAHVRSAELEGELTDLVKDKAKLQESSEKLKEALAELAKRKAAADKRVAEFRKLLSKSWVRSLKTGLLKLGPT